MRQWTVVRKICLWISCERISGEFRRVDPHPTEEVGDDIPFSLDVSELGTEFFDKKSPPHYSFSIELFERQVFVIGEDFDLMSQEYVPVLFQGFNDTQEFSLCSGVSCLCIIKLSDI